MSDDERTTRLLTPAGPAPDVPTDAGGGDDDGGDDDGVYVQASITVFGNQKSTGMYFSEMPSDTDLAAELFAAVSALAVLSGSGVWFELQRRFASAAR